MTEELEAKLNELGLSAAEIAQGVLSMTPELLEGFTQAVVTRQLMYYTVYEIVWLLASACLLVAGVALHMASKKFEHKPDGDAAVVGSVFCYVLGVLFCLLPSMHNIPKILEVFLAPEFIVVRHLRYLL